MADWLRPIAEQWPDLPVWCTTGGAGHELTNHLRGIPEYDDFQNMDLWNPSPSRLVGKHGYRDGSIVDKARHCFSFVYEGQPEARLTVDDEPPGVSDFVSVITNREQLRDPAGVATIFLTAAVVRPVVGLLSRPRAADRAGRELPRALRAAGAAGGAAPRRPVDLPRRSVTAGRRRARACGK